MNDEIWVLGATGRTGRAVVARLHAAGHPVVLVGRARERLAGLAADLDGGPRVLAGSLEAVLGELAQDAPAAVVNTVGPFTVTAPQVARACPPGTHYVDVANEFGAAAAILDHPRGCAWTPSPRSRRRPASSAPPSPRASWSASRPADGGSSTDA